MVILKKKLIGFKLNLEQKIVNQLYKHKGASDYVLMKQLKINKERNKHNITDKSKRIYEEFVQ